MKQLFGVLVLAALALLTTNAIPIPSSGPGVSGGQGMSSLPPDVQARIDGEYLARTKEMEDLVQDWPRGVNKDLYIHSSLTIYLRQRQEAIAEALEAEKQKKEKGNVENDEVASENGDASNQFSLPGEVAHLAAGATVATGTAAYIGSQVTNTFQEEGS